MVNRLFLRLGLLGCFLAAAALPALAQSAENPNLPENMKYRTIIEQAKEKGSVMEMTLDECVERALQKNLSIEVQHYLPLMSREQFHAALGVYDYQLKSNIGYQKMERPVMSTLQQEYLKLDTTLSKDLTFGATLSKYLSTGGSFTISSDNDRSTSNTNRFSPTYSGAVKLGFTQPLWRDFSIDQNRRTILLAKKDKTISELDFEAQVSDIARTVEVAYWDLVNAIEQQKIQIASRELSLIQLRDNRKRVEVGTLAPIIITQTMAEVAQAEQSVIASEADIVRAQNALKNFVCNEKGDELWVKTILPKQMPIVPQAIPTVEELIDKAVEQRPEVKKYRLTLERDDIDIKFFRNQKKPRLDFDASYTSNGLASPNYRENVYDNDGNVIGEQDGRFTGNLGTVYEQIFKQKYRDYSVGLTLTYTFGNKTAEANLAVAKLSKGQDEATLRQTVQNIEVDVFNAVQTIEVSRKSLVAALATRKFQEEQLDGQQKRYQAGLTTNFEVLQTQRDLTNAKAAELSALITLKKAFVELNRATFSILDQNKMDIVGKRLDKDK